MSDIDRGRGTKTRERMLRKRAATLGRRATRHANGFDLLDGEGVPVLVDSLDAVEVRAAMLSAL